MKSFQEFASLLEDNSYLEKGKKASIVQGAVSGNPKALWLLSKQRIAENDIYSGETLLFQAAFENCPEAQGDIGDVYFYGRFNRENARIMLMQTQHIETLDGKIELLDKQLDDFLNYKARKKRQQKRMEAKLAQEA